MIPMEHDLLKNTEDMVPNLGPLCFEIEGKTLKELDDDTLSRSIAGFALRVSFWHSVFFFLSLLLFLTRLFSISGRRR